VRREGSTEVGRVPRKEAGVQVPQKRDTGCVVCVVAAEEGQGMTGGTCMKNLVQDGKVDKEVIRDIHSYLLQCNKTCRTAAF
jgi:hypothetical protein